MGMNRIALITVVALLALSVPHPAFAYVGPGAGLTVVGAALALVGSILLAIVGFIWYPLKRLWRAVAGRRTKAEGASADGLSA